MTGILAEVLTLVGRETSRIVLHATCIVCGIDLPWSRRVRSCCLECWSSIETLDEGRCLKCALARATSTDDGLFICIGCRSRRSPLRWLDAWGPYHGTLERVLHAFKFEGHDFLSRPLAELLARRWQERRESGAYVIVPVPMHPKGLRERGYNQSARLASDLGGLLDLPVKTRALSKVRPTRTQSTLPRKDRRDNVRGAFAASSSLEGVSVLLVDDICTTGETIRACARSLGRAGADDVVSLVVARA